jgi:hypothetical protein
MSCNFGKARNGGICPHQQNKQKGIPFLVERAVGF